MGAVCACRRECRRGAHQGFSPDFCGQTCGKLRPRSGRENSRPGREIQIPFPLVFGVVGSYVSFCSDRETGRSPGRAEILETKPRTPGSGMELRLRTGVWSPSGRRIGPNIERWTGTLGPLRRDGGPIGTSAGNGGRSPRGRGPWLRPRDPAAGLLRKSAATVKAARPERSHERFGGSGGPRIERSEGSRKAARSEGEFGGRKARERPMSGRPGVGAGRPPASAEV